MNMKRNRSLILRYGKHGMRLTVMSIGRPRFGKGRPGWHIECSAMSMKYLGESFRHSHWWC